MSSREMIRFNKKHMQADALSFIFIYLIFKKYDKLVLKIYVFVILL